MRPWDYHPELTEERLVTVAQLLQRGRGDAVDRFDPAVGDNNWTRGVCAYSYACHQIRLVAGTPGFEWLSVISDGIRFQFGIGGVPLRFFRGDPSEPSGRVTAATPFEQLLLELEPDVATAGMLFRIGMTTDEDGALLEASFVAVRNGAPETVWRLPLDEAAPLLVLLGNDRPEGRDLPPPPVGDPADGDSVFSAAASREG